MSRRPPPSKQTARMRTLADELDDAEDELSGQPQIHVNGGTVLLGDTGKFPAVRPEEITKPDAALRAPISDTPAKVKAAKSFFEVFPGWGRVLVALAILGVVGLAIWKGVSLPSLF